MKAIKSLSGKRLDCLVMLLVLLIVFLGLLKYARREDTVSFETERAARVSMTDTTVMQEIQIDSDAVEHLCRCAQ